MMDIAKFERALSDDDFKIEFINSILPTNFGWLNISWNSVSMTIEYINSDIILDVWRIPMCDWLDYLDKNYTEK